MRPIDADALIQNHFSDEHRIALSYADKLWMRRIISDEPTIDAVPVVRCVQCKHWKINPNNLYGGYCRYCDSAKMDHFCSYGERKETES